MATPKWYNIANIIAATVFVALFMGVFAIPQEKVLIGVLMRGWLALIILFNALFLLLTKHKSFLMSRDQHNRRLFMAVLLLAVGLATLITAFMGYGINGYPLLHWTHP